MKETDVLSFSMTGFDGVSKTYHLRPVMRKEAMVVFDKFLKSVVLSLSSGVDGLSALLGSGVAGADMVTAASAIGKAVNALDFDTVWGVADVLFAGGSVTSESSAPIHDKKCSLDFAALDGPRHMGVVAEDYFRDHPDEFYQATVRAVGVNWPGVFTLAQAKLGDLFSKIEKKPPVSID